MQPLEFFNAGKISPKARSTASHAFIAACKSPVWPTISGLAKLTMIRSILFLIAATSCSVTSVDDISGARSYVATFGLLGINLVSPTSKFSSPPLRKNVT